MRYCQICTTPVEAVEEVETEPSRPVPGALRAPRRLWLCARHAESVRKRRAEIQASKDRRNVQWPAEGLF